MTASHSRSEKPTSNHRPCASGCVTTSECGGGGLRGRSRSMAKRTIADRFWAKVHKHDGDGCWEWRGSVDKKGYGLIAGVTGATVRAHRLSWEMHFGAIPDGLLVCHKCDNPSCVRPDHLFLGTYTDNKHDAMRKGRSRGAPTVTHCKRGHLMTGDNCGFSERPNGRAMRYCRTCKLAREKARYQQKCALWLTLKGTPDAR